MNQKWRDAQLPEELCAAAEERFGSDFSSLQEFLEFIVRELVATDAAALDQNELHVVEERLRDLGYI